jgi:cytochrome c biogenesis protein
MEQRFRVPAELDVAWQGTDVSFRIAELKTEQDGAVQQARIQLTTSAGGSSDIWVKNQETLTFRHAGEDFTISFRQYYSTLLLVTKDPGVLIVYFGCILMVVGLAISFLLSHRRVWVRISKGAQHGSQILVSGTSNKNKSAFEPRFQEMFGRVEQELSSPAKKKKK